MNEMDAKKMVEGPEGEGLNFMLIFLNSCWNSIVHESLVRINKTKKAFCIFINFYFF